MSETVKIILMILLTIGAFILSRWIAGWQMNKAGESIIRDLKARKAVDPESAVELPYCKSRMFRLGLRDYRPRVMEQLVKHDVVRILEGGKYYLREGRNLSEKGDRTDS
ncbi:MAG: hypothetical protein C0390_10260 [Syntrophus sp. (in: bacteria)]|nr:hypothetical protein [Syntrophus sp. (in: bacteria)]